MLVFTPDRRISADEALCHKYFECMRDERSIVPRDIFRYDVRDEAIDSINEYEWQEQDIAAIDEWKSNNLYLQFNIMN